jgi:hypothetical protein
VNVDSFRFVPRSFRPLYEGRGPFPGEEAPVWVPFEKRLSESRIALLTSAGMYLKDRQPPFDLDGERARPEWGDPTWRSIPATVQPADVAFAHLHLNADDQLVDPEIALPAHGLDELVKDGIVGSATSEHLSVMGYQESSLEGWREQTAPELVARLHDLGANGLILAPA